MALDWKQLDVVTLDFETYYSTEYSLRLKEYNTSSYIRDPQYKSQCVGIKINGMPVYSYSEEHSIQDAIDAIDWSRSALLCHNTAFDGLILSHHYGVVPAFYLDTMSMAACIFGHSVSHSLDNLSELLGLGAKIKGALASTQGIVNIPPDVMRVLEEYCREDVRLTYELFQTLRPLIPDDEIRLIDITMRMFCDPVLRVDTALLAKVHAEEQGAKRSIIKTCDATAEQLSSNVQFAQLLRDAGVEPPMKISNRTGKETFAFSKGDKEFMALKQHPNVNVRLLVDARLRIKSNIMETRALRLIDAGSDGMCLPVGLKYYGAHTGRWSGTNKLNLQNLTRGSDLRLSIMAPEGCVLNVGDLAQIEPRVLAYISNHVDLLTQFRNKDDVYKNMASKIYNVPYNEVTKEQRQVGKVCVLGLGYGMGYIKFVDALKAMTGIDITEEQSQEIVWAYRGSNPSIVGLWREMDNVIKHMSVEGLPPYYVCNGLVKVGYQHLELPNGTRLLYPGLHAIAEVINEDRVTVSFKYKSSIREWSYIYGGLLVENIVQALARIVIAEQMLVVADNYRVVMTTHDELVIVSPEPEAEKAQEFLMAAMSTPPKWAPLLPVAADGGYDVRYSK